MTDDEKLDDQFESAVRFVRRLERAEERLKKAEELIYTLLDDKSEIPWITLVTEARAFLSESEGRKP